MQPIHEILSRIRWDTGFTRAHIEIAYYDRVRREEVVVPLSRVQPAVQDARTFVLLDEEGDSRRVPLHRIRKVYRDGRIIWQRPSSDR